LGAVTVGSGDVTTLSTDPMPSAAAFSPDGKEIAFSSSRDGNAEIYIAHADGSRLRRLTFHPGIDTAPTWSPSGRRLAFTSDRTGTPQIFVVDRDGGNVEQLTFSGEWNDSPDWSPRADRIVHVSHCDEGFELALIQADGSNWQRLTVGGGCENPRWAPDGRHVVFARSRSGTRNLWVLGVDSGRVRELTVSREPSYNPAWSRPSQERPGAARQGG
jgi:TolB protein